MSIDRTRRRRVAVALLLTAAVATGGAWAIALRAPQVVVLADEGFPSAVWPVSGRFERVEGAHPQPAPPAGTAASPQAQARFSAAGGRALLVDQGGTLLVEQYGPDASRETKLNSYSLIKSLVGTLVLLAVSEGRIDGLAASLQSILGPDAPDITVKQALTMTSGLEMEPEPPKTDARPMDDLDFSPFGPLARLHAFGPEAILQDLEVNLADRGTFHYQSANTALLGLVLERVYGQPLQELLADKIWRPSGAAPADWRVYPKADRVTAYCCLYARAIDWARVGRFVMKNGTDGAPLLPPELWRSFVLPNLSAAERRNGAYGMHLRHDVLDRDGAAPHGPFAYLMGHSGQVVYLLPEQDIVVVRFGAEAQLLHSTLYELLAE